MSLLLRFLRPLLLLLTLFPLSMAQSLSAAAMVKEIERYQKGKDYIQQENWAAYQVIRQELTPSLLLPYLEYYYYEKMLDQLPPSEILTFIERYPDHTFITTLKTRLFQWQLEKRNYSFLLENEALLSTQNMRCMFYSAQLNENPDLFNGENFKKEWINALTLPSSCNLAERHWLKRGVADRILKQKIFDRLERNYITRAKELIPYLSTSEQEFHRLMIPIVEDPKKILTMHHFPESGSRYYALAIDRWSKQNSVAAQAGLDHLMQFDALELQDFIPIRNQLAVFQAGRNDAVAPLKRIKNIPVQERDDQVLQWGFRLAANKKDYHLAYQFLTQMSNEAQEETTWTYWRGNMLERQGYRAEAVREYQKIANQPSFYGFLAADHLSARYAVLQQMIQDPAGSALLPTNDKIRRALILHEAKEKHFARSEWFAGLRELTEQEQHFASIYAYQQSLYDFSIRAAISARSKGGLTYRYPQNYLEQIAPHLLDTAWLTTPIVLGLIRQESLFHEEAKSGANAYGLMQLLIPTADKMARLLGEKREPLYNPEANIRYGITYLKYLGDEVGQCLPHVLASYNAGPSRVKSWLKKESDDLLLWIESIPYYETRNYVKNVIENAIIYHHINGDSARISQYLKCPSSAH